MKMLCHSYRCAQFAILCWLAGPPLVPAQETPRQHISLHVALTRLSFRNVNESDAKAAFRIFAQSAGRKRGYDVDAEVRLFDNPAECEAEIKKGTVQLAILDVWDYLGMDINPAMEPMFVHLEQGSVLRNYLLLTRRGNGLTNLASLRGRDLTVFEGKGGNICRAWLGRLLLTNHLEPMETFFSRLEPVTKPATAVLPVFFGTKTACLVDRGGLQIMSELNPQVGSNLVIVASSEPFLESITCLSKAGWASEHTRQDVIKCLEDLHLDPEGRQILLLFKLDRLVPFKNEYLDSARTLKAASEPPARSTTVPLAGGQTGN